jgi:hypothetical protein
MERFFLLVGAVGKLKAQQLERKRATQLNVFNPLA